MKKIFELLSRSKISTKILFSMWCVMTLLEAAVLVWMVFRGVRTWQIVIPIVGLAVCWNGWRGWLHLASIEDTIREQEKKLIARWLECRKTHSSLPNPDKS